MPSSTVLHRAVISSRSLDAALPVYEVGLGLAVEARADGFASLRTGDGLELMFHERPASASDAAVALTFAVDGLDRAIERWTAAGGAVVDPPAAQPWGERMAVVRDADGHLVCLVESP
ncbi:VOC family protein [Leifsonia sp. NPDC077715]|uniref:VOC family protein n=1 Tax=Leifsonia sp. NPDC077715 TaxID=3155539 RepID=UPI00343C4B0C